MRQIEKIVSTNMRRAFHTKVKNGLSGERLDLERKKLNRKLDFLKKHTVFIADDSLREVWDNEADDAWDNY